MFLGRARAARALYLRYKGQRVEKDGKLWEEAILDDFKEFEKRRAETPADDGDQGAPRAEMSTAHALDKSGRIRLFSVIRMVQEDRTYVRESIELGKREFFRKGGDGAVGISRGRACARCGRVFP